MRSWLKTFLPLFLETLPLFGLIFVINPVLIAFIPREPFEYKWSFVILSIAGVCLATLTAFSISFFSTKYRQIAIAIFRSLFVIFFVVSIFYPESGRQLDGGISEDFSWFYYFIIYSIYTISFFVLMALFVRKNFVIRNVYVALVILGFASVVYYPVQKWATSEPQTYYSDKTDLTFASDRNIIFIFADMLQGSTLEQYLTMYPNEKNNLQGFTLFSRAVSPFPFTSYAAPALMTGSLYSNVTNDTNVEKNATSVDASKDSSFVTDAASAEFDSTVIGLDIVKLHKDQFSYQSSTPLETAYTLLELSIQKITKKSVQAMGLNPRKDPNMWLVGYKKTSKEVMDRLAISPIGKSKNKIIFFHSMVSHAPIVFKRKNLEAMPLVLKPLKLNGENYFEEMGFFLGQVSHLLAHMKEIGIYDKSLIIITGDHGHFVGEKSEIYTYPGAEDFDGLAKGPWSPVVAMYNAAILIKPPLQSGPLQISRAASSTLGLRPVVQKYLADETSNVLRDFEILGKNKVVVFKRGIKSNPFQVADDHIVNEFIGNVSALAKQFEKDDEKDWLGNVSYKIGATVTNIHEYLDGKWIKEPGGAWLKTKPAILVFNPSNLENKNYKLRLVYTTFVNERHPNKSVRLWLNGKEIGALSFATSGQKTVELDIPANLLIDFANELKFEPLNPEDISICLHSFQLLEGESNKVGTQSDASYKIGTKITDVSKYIDDGWIKEPEGAWLKEKPAKLILNTVGIKNKAYKLQMVCTSLINGQHPKQRVRMWLNGKELGMLSFTTPGEQTVDLDIPTNLLVNGVNEFKFEPLDPISPKEIGAWDFPQPISIYLHSFQLINP